MPSRASVLFLFLAKDYNFDVVIKLIVTLTLNVFSKIVILVSRYVRTNIALTESGLHNNRVLTILILNDTYSRFSFMSRDCY